MAVQKKIVEMTYKELMSQSEGTIEAENLDLQVQKVKSGIEVGLAESARDLVLAKQKLSSTIRSANYTVQAEIDAEEDVKALEAGILKAKSVLKERF